MGQTLQTVTAADLAEKVAEAQAFEADARALYSGGAHSTLGQIPNGGILGMYDAIVAAGPFGLTPAQLARLQGLAGTVDGGTFPTASGQTPAVAPSVAAAVPDLDPANLTGGWAESQTPNEYEYPVAGIFAGEPTPTVTASGAGNVEAEVASGLIVVTLQGPGATGTVTYTGTNSAGALSDTFEVLAPSASAQIDLDDLDDGQTFQSGTGGQPVLSAPNGSWEFVMAAPSASSTFVLWADPNDLTNIVRALPKANGNFLVESPAGGTIVSLANGGQTFAQGDVIRVTRSAGGAYTLRKNGAVVNQTSGVTAAAGKTSWALTPNNAPGSFQSAKYYPNS